VGRPDCGGREELSCGSCNDRPSGPEENDGGTTLHAIGYNAHDRCREVLDIRNHPTRLQSRCGGTHHVPHTCGGEGCGDNDWKILIVPPEREERRHGTHAGGITQLSHDRTDMFGRGECGKSIRSPTTLDPYKVAESRESICDLSRLIGRGDDEDGDRRHVKASLLTSGKAVKTFRVEDAAL